MLTIRQKISIKDPEKEYILLTPIEHRKKYAQFFTPMPIALFMAKWILGNKYLETILDPAFGLGIMARAIRQLNTQCLIKGFDIDSHIIYYTYNIFENDSNTSIFLKEYIYNDWDNKYDGIICNPPYFKFHDYDNLANLTEIEYRLGLKLNGFTNLYTLFLLKSAYQLNKNGRAAYVVPSEFLNSDYGNFVKSYLIKNKLLRYIIVFDFEENLFDNALTTSSILLFANDNEKEGVEFINIKKLDELLDLQIKIQKYPEVIFSNCIPFSELKPEIKWRAYYQKQNALEFKNLVPFSYFGKVVRGIATGANDYFIFNRSKAKSYNISDKYLLPCITKSIDVKGSFFTTKDFETLKTNDKDVYLLNAITLIDVYLKEYIKKGEVEEIHKKNLTANRNPWYKLEKRPPSPIWVSVFNRNGLRFIRNEASICNLTTFHCIYLNMYSEPKSDLLFAYLLTDISRKIFNDNCREYGNGLQKFEPNDINKSLIVDINLIQPIDEQNILKLYHEYRATELNKMPNEKILQDINSIFEDIFLK